jgi:protocatechuate 3,4-dioxygenase beta subunit
MSIDEHDHDRGLQFDMGTLIGRRRLLGLLAGAAGAVAFAGCGGDDDDVSSGTTTTTAAGSTASTASSSTATTATTAASTEATTATTASGESTTPIPEETGGPYPADGSNGPNVLAESGVVRRDITTSFGDLSGTAAGVPLTMSLNLSDASGGSALAGAAVYLWHCDQAGRYSLYSEGATDQNYLRGVQESDADGVVTFTSIFPAAYSGRWPHIHFEVYASLDDATGGASPVTTSQVALPEDVCDLVYETDGYDASVRNMSQTSLTSDNVFGDDGAVRQLATVTGSVDTGFVATLAVPV